MIADQLPLTSRQKLTAITQLADDSEALARACFGAITAAERQFPALVNAMKSASDPTKAKAMQAEINSLRSEIERLKVVQAARNTRAAIDREIALRVRGWLHQQPPTARFAIPSPSKRIASLAGASGIADLRREIEKLKTELQAVETAPPPPDLIKAKARAWIDDLAARGTPMLKVTSGEFDVKWPRAALIDPGSLPENALVLACWLHRDAMIAAMEQEIDRHVSSASDQPPLTETAKAARRQELAARILAAERSEESLIEGAPEVARRPDASALAILGVVAIAPAASKAGKTVEAIEGAGAGVLSMTGKALGTASRTA